MVLEDVLFPKGTFPVFGLETNPLLGSMRLDPKTLEVGAAPKTFVVCGAANSPVPPVVGVVVVVPNSPLAVGAVAVVPNSPLPVGVVVVVPNSPLPVGVVVVVPNRPLPVGVVVVVPNSPLAVGVVVVVPNSPLAVGVVVVELNNPPEADVAAVEPNNPPVAAAVTVVGAAPNKLAPDTVPPLNKLVAVSVLTGGAVLPKGEALGLSPKRLDVKGLLLAANNPELSAVLTSVAD